MNDQSPPARGRNKARSGGRAARHAMRAAPLSAEKQPIKPGMTGGTYNPLSETDIARIYEAALVALAEIGLSDAPESGVAAMTAAGAQLGADGRLRFPRALVEKMLGRAQKDVTLCARDPQYDLNLSGTRVHYGTAGAAVHMVDVTGRNYRESTLQDLHDAARLVQALDNIHFLQRPMVARDVIDNKEMDLNTIYSCCSGTTKHVGTSFTEPDFVADALEMLHMMAGSEAAWRARPFVLNSNCFVVPPMKFATESCQVMENCIAGGMPVLLLSAGQAGATAPAPIAGAIVQAVAECLAGDTLGLATMREVCIGGPGHYLGSGQTLGLMETEYVYPAVADRTSPKEWQEKDKPDLIANAIARKDAILRKPSAAAFPPDVDAAIRARFNIHLKPFDA